MKSITAKYIRTFNPCSDRILNFENHYPKFDGTIIEFLQLENITYFDKLWVSVKVIDYKVLQMWSVLCSESVLGNYEKQFPNDSRIRDCIEITKRVNSGELKQDSSEFSAARSAAWSAAESAARSTARSTARSAAESAASAASAAESAARSTAWSAAWSAASAARSAAWSAARSTAGSAAEREQEDMNILMLISLLEK